MKLQAHIIVDEEDSFVQRRVLADKQFSGIGDYFGLLSRLT